MSNNLKQIVVLLHVVVKALETIIKTSDESKVDNDERDEIAKKIRQWRQKRNLTQQQLARKSGLPQSHISRIENGIHIPNHQTIKRIAKALKTTTEQLSGI